jgi:hypothetical protein
LDPLRVLFHTFIVPLGQVLFDKFIIARYYIQRRADLVTHVRYERGLQTRGFQGGVTRALEKNSLFPKAIDDRGHDGNR